ncbi:hypothetical protein [Dactylosporangium sp. NPDC051541]|uniref:hypothetical protein n=1 Tax=Dactylosporangium sp. NPDC051541 TaxID=3363977 RepID=UPI0037BDD583
MDDWVRGRTGLVSIDVDYFMHGGDPHLVAPLREWFARAVRDGARVVFRDDHVDLVELVTRPVDFIVNLDHHMDLRLEFLHGAPARRPPVNASVFETLLADGLTERYVWAHPPGRRRAAALAYSSAFAAGRQSLLPRIHCVEGRSAVRRIMCRAEVGFVFVCRSPDYADATTDAVFHDLRRLGSPAAPGVRS